MRAFVCVRTSVRRACPYGGGWGPLKGATPVAEEGEADV